MPNTLTISVRGKDGANVAALFDTLTKNGTIPDISFPGGPGPAGTASISLPGSLTLTGAGATLTPTATGLFVPCTPYGVVRFNALTETVRLCAPDGAILQTLEGASREVFGETSGEGEFTYDGSSMQMSGPWGTQLFSTSGAGTELQIPYDTVGGEVQTEGFILIPDTLPTIEARFAEPEGLGFGSWGEPVSTVVEGLLGDTRIDFRGSRADDAALGFDFNDRLRMGAGDDVALGGGGNDILIGGRGNDLLIGGPGQDRLLGGNGNDLLIGGPGDDRMDGGNGNDILVVTSGFTLSRGGRGSDVWIHDWINGATGEDQTRTVIRDFGSDDLLAFAGLPGDYNEDGVVDGSLLTLADLENGTLDEFQWRQTNRGVEIEAGDGRVLLRGVQADEVDIDQILFSQRSVEDTVMLFDSVEGGGTLGTPPGGDPYLVLTLEHLTGISNGETSFTTYGGDVSGFLDLTGGLT